MCEQEDGVGELYRLSCVCERGTREWIGLRSIKRDNNESLGISIGIWGVGKVSSIQSVRLGGTC